MSPSLSVVVLEKPGRVRFKVTAHYFGQTNNMVCIVKYIYAVQMIALPPNTFICELSYMSHSSEKKILDYKKTQNVNRLD